MSINSIADYKQAVSNFYHYKSDFADCREEYEEERPEILTRVERLETKHGLLSSTDQIVEQAISKMHDPSYTAVNNLSLTNSLRDSNYVNSAKDAIKAFDTFFENLDRVIRLEILTNGDVKEAEALVLDLDSQLEEMQAALFGQSQMSNGDFPGLKNIFAKTYAIFHEVFSDLNLGSLRSTLRPFVEASSQFEINNVVKDLEDYRPSRNEQAQGGLAFADDESSGIGSFDEYYAAYAEEGQEQSSWKEVDDTSDDIHFTANTYERNWVDKPTQKHLTWLKDQIHDYRNGDLSFGLDEDKDRVLRAFQNYQKSIWQEVKVFLDKSEKLKLKPNSALDLDDIYRMNLLGQENSLKNLLFLDAVNEAKILQKSPRALTEENYMERIDMKVDSAKRSLRDGLEKEIKILIGFIGAFMPSYLDDEYQCAVQRYSYDLEAGLYESYKANADLIEKELGLDTNQPGTWSAAAEGEPARLGFNKFAQRNIFNAIDDEFKESHGSLSVAALDKAFKAFDLRGFKELMQDITRLAIKNKVDDEQILHFTYLSVKYFNAHMKNQGQFSYAKRASRGIASIPSLLKKVRS